MRFEQVSADTHVIFIGESAGLQLWEKQLSVDLDLKAPWEDERDLLDKGLWNGLLCDNNVL